MSCLQEEKKVHESEGISHRFQYLGLGEKQQCRIVLLRSLAIQLAEAIVENTCCNRERSLALTKLEETMFWANRGVAVNPQQE